MGFYVESADRPHESKLAGEDIDVGVLVTDNGSDKFRRAEATDDRINYVADKIRRADYIAFDEDDTLSRFEYVASDNDRVPGQPLADGDVIKTLTPRDNSTDPAADISANDVVGIAAVGGREFEGRIVEEGYTDNGGTTYGRNSTGDFLTLGTVYRDDASDFDEAVRVRVNRDNQD